MTTNRESPTSSGYSKARRYIECTLFVLAWMGCGSFFHLGGSGYLLLGVPLVVAFQLLVVRRPLQQLWARNAQSFRLNAGAIAMASAVLLVPAWAYACGIRSYGIMFLVAAAGIIPFAIALRHQSRPRLISALPSFGAALIVGCGWFATLAIWGGSSAHSVGFAATKIPILFSDFFCITLAGFVVEEVAFRGAIDSHVASAAGTRLDALFSAMFVSLLWGIWHLPLGFLYPSRDLGFIGVALLINILLGTPMSYCWRKSGTLILPSMAHALCDAYRNIISM